MTDKTAASGTKSLRLADGPDLGAPWQPHLIAKIGAEQGSVRIRWSFRTDDKAHPQFECRDYKQDGARPYAVGPSITSSETQAMLEGCQRLSLSEVMVKTL